MYDRVRGTFSESSAWPENVTLRGEEEVHGPWSDLTLQVRFTDLPVDAFCFWERSLPHHSQESSGHLASFQSLTHVNRLVCV